jgi:hypothetical protein
MSPGRFKPPTLPSLWNGFVKGKEASYVLHGDVIAWAVGSIGRLHFGEGRDINAVCEEVNEISKHHKMKLKTGEIERNACIRTSKVCIKKKKRSASTRRVRGWIRTTNSPLNSIFAYTNRRE